jgi:hypothetical protein
MRADLLAVFPPPPISPVAAGETQTETVMIPSPGRESIGSPTELEIYMYKYKYTYLYSGLFGVSHVGLNHCCFFKNHWFKPMTVFSSELEPKTRKMRNYLRPFF